MGFSPVRLNHAVLFVADLARSVRFYTEVFGMQVIAREPRADAAFLRLPGSENHHDLGLFGIDTDSGGGPARRRRVGLYHLAWQLDTIDELADARQTLLDAGAYSGESATVPPSPSTAPTPTATSSRSCGCSRANTGAPYEHAAPVDRLDLDAEIERWSGIRTADPIQPSNTTHA